MFDELPMSRLNTCFLRNVRYDATVEEVRTALEQHVGGVRRVELLRDATGEGHRGCGFVEFENSDGYRLALTHGGLDLRGRRLIIEHARTEYRPPRGGGAR